MDAAAMIRAQAVEIERLKIHLKQEQDDNAEMLLIAHLNGAADAKDEVKALKVEIERLREALKPFADCAEYLEAETTGFHDDDCLTLVAGEEQFALWRDLNHGDFRRARAALGSKT